MKIVTFDPFYQPDPNNPKSGMSMQEAVRALVLQYNNTSGMVEANFDRILHIVKILGEVAAATEFTDDQMQRLIVYPLMLVNDDGSTIDDGSDQ